MKTSMPQKHRRTGLCDEPWSWGSLQLDYFFVQSVRHSWEKFLSFSSWPNAKEMTQALQLSTGLDYQALDEIRRRTAVSQESADYRTNVELYCETIICHKTIPTRPQNWHDFLNLLVWMSFPKAKIHLTKVQWDAAVQYKVRGPQSGRGRPLINDRITLLDEGGCLMAVPHGKVPEVLRIFECPDYDERLRWMRQMNYPLYFFGHGLMETLFVTQKQIYACVLVLGQDEEFFQRPYLDQITHLDRDMCIQLTPERLEAKWQMGSLPVDFVSGLEKETL